MYSRTPLISSRVHILSYSTHAYLSVYLFEQFHFLPPITCYGRDSHSDMLYSRSSVPINVATRGRILRCPNTGRGGSSDFLLRFKKSKKPLQGGGPKLAKIPLRNLCKAPYYSTEPLLLFLEFLPLSVGLGYCKA